MDTILQKLLGSLPGVQFESVRLSQQSPLVVYFRLVGAEETYVLAMCFGMNHAFPDSMLIAWPYIPYKVVRMLTRRLPMTTRLWVPPGFSIWLGIDEAALKLILTDG